MANALVTLGCITAALVAAGAGRRRVAALLVLTAATWWLGDLFTEAALLHRGPLLHLLLAYPDGRLSHPNERVAVTLAYACGASVDAGSLPLVTLGFGALLIGSTTARWASVRGPARRRRAAPAVAGLVAGAPLAIGAAGRLLVAGDDPTVLLAYELALSLACVVLAADLHFGAWTSATLTGLIVDLGRPGEGTLDARLGRALGDRTLRIGYRVQDCVHYVDERGEPIVVEPADPRRTITPIHHAGRELAVIVHDRAVRDDWASLEDVAAPVAVALANTQARSDLLTRVAEVDASRRRIVTAAEAERRRFSEQLRKLTEPHFAAAAERLAQAPAAAALELQLRSLRSGVAELAEGLHPARLAELGLDGALAQLAAGSALEVVVEGRAGLLPEPVEATVWFVCCEALANVAKHGHATRAQVHAAHNADSVHVEIRDDGRGGADPARGSGLRGLAERAEALGGTLSIADGARGGTVVTLELPLW